MTIPSPVFDPAFRITRASHVVLNVADLAASKAFYVDILGFLVSAEETGTLYLRGIEEGCHHSLVLKARKSVDCERLGMRVLTEEDLSRVHAHFAKEGLPAKWVEVPHQGRTLHVNDVVGTPLEFCATMETRPRAIMRFNEHKGACPQRIDHFQIITPGVQEACDFYMAMGFRLSEYIVPDDSDELAFVFLQRKGNPHDIVFARGPGPRLHHAAFFVPEAHQLLLACDLLAENGYGRSVEWGPCRHYGPGYARFVYLRDPDGHRIELFNNHYQTMDIEDEPIKWKRSQVLGAGWGGPPPQSWLEEARPFAGADVQ